MKEILERRTIVSVKIGRSLYSNAQSLRSPKDSNANARGRMIEHRQCPMIAREPNPDMYKDSQPAKRRAPNERQQMMYLGEPSGVKSTTIYVVGPARQPYDGTRAAPQSSCEPFRLQAYPQWRQMHLSRWKRSEERRDLRWGQFKEPMAKQIRWICCVAA